MEIPNEKLSKIMLFNSHPVADLLENEFTFWKDFHNKCNIKRQQINDDESDDELHLKISEFDSNSKFLFKKRRRITFGLNCWKGFDMMLERRRQTKITFNFADLEYESDDNYDN